MGNVSSNAWQHFINYLLNLLTQHVHLLLALANFFDNILTEKIFNLLSNGQQSRETVNAGANAKGVHQVTVLFLQVDADGVLAKGKKLCQVLLRTVDLSFQLSSQKLELPGVVD